MDAMMDLSWAIQCQNILADVHDNPNTFNELQQRIKKKLENKSINTVKGTYICFQLKIEKSRGFKDGWFKYALKRLRKIYHKIQLERDQIKIYVYDKETETKTDIKLEGLFMPIETVSELVENYKNVFS